MKLDDTDLAILGILKNNARVTNKDLAHSIGLSPSACLARVRRLEEQGIIAGYRAIVAPGKQNNLLEGWASVRFMDPAPVSPKSFSDTVAGMPEVVGAYRVAGPYEYLLRVSAVDVSAWTSCQRRLEALVGQPQVNFCVLLEALK